MAGVTGLDHVNIRTTDIAASTAFYTQVLGLTATPPAGLAMPPTANWLFDAEGRPILHLRLLAPDGGGAGALDHVALRCTGLIETIVRLEAAGVRYDRFDTAAPAATQLLVTDPHGVRLELVFRDA